MDLIVTVNDERRTLPDGTTVSDLLALLDLRVDLVAVERNGEIVPKASHAETPLRDGDRLEVVTFVGGG
ncbi:MAG: sulfur carrier protein ThiS [Planctomycetota bacterium JB042]